MWTHGVLNSGKVHNNETPLEGINRYELWEKNIDLLIELGVKHYRTSVSISRILTKDMGINNKADTWYKNYFQKLKENYKKYT